MRISSVLFEIEREEEVKLSLRGQIVDRLLFPSSFFFSNLFEVHALEVVVSLK